MVGVQWVPPFPENYTHIKIKGEGQSYSSTLQPLVNNSIKELPANLIKCRTKTERKKTTHTCKKKKKDMKVARQLGKKESIS